MAQQGASNRGRRAFGWLAAGLLLAGAASAQNPRVSIMVGGIDKIIYLPAMLTERLGYFKAEGLDVQLLSEPAGVEATDELIAGQVQGVVGFYDHTIDVQTKGKMLESVVQFSRAPGEVELVSSKAAASIKSPADFRGKNLGVTGLGSSTSFLTQYLATRYKVPISAITLLPVEAGNTFIAAMQQGRIDAGMTTEPTVSRLLKTGEARVLLDLRSPTDTVKYLGGPYPAASLYMSTDWVNSHKDIAQKLANAFVKTLKYISTHSGEEIARLMPADYYAGDRAMYVKALDSGKIMFTPDGVMPANGPQTVLSVLSTFDPSVKGQHVDLSKTYTTEFVKAAR